MVTFYRNYLTRRYQVEVCETCEGDGIVVDEDGDDMTCLDCNGTGEEKENVHAEQE